jgi:SAM-dependent methyltransferase
MDHSMGGILSKFTNSTARKPQGKWARDFYGEPKSHMKGFAAVLEELKPRKDDIYLEIGCGGGYFLNQVQARVARVAAIDHSPEMVTLARQTNQAAIDQGRAEIVQGNAEHLPWPDDSFTCTANTSMWFFIEHPQAVLAELYRVLQPDGRLVIATIRRSLINRIIWSLYSLRLYSDGQMSDMLRQAGFSDIRVTSQGLMGQIVTARKQAKSG